MSGTGFVWEGFSRRRFRQALIDEYVYGGQVETLDFPKSKVLKKNSTATRTKRQRELGAWLGAVMLLPSINNCVPLQQNELRVQSLNAASPTSAWCFEEASPATTLPNGSARPLSQIRSLFYNRKTGEAARLHFHSFICAISLV